ncbi:MFS transporter [Kroppenstedtia pulmonis]|uniref:MFS transporter n=1 Tax=Kroppenstedtia pulmonis TaxID=1380685 RepID=A0A7D3XIE1_9BACL|nr:MFS transporter [Kroppenstedtia pulmonis]QKG84444.1 MFS transporter [Kroppenstedtia pulmonis]
MPVRTLNKNVILMICIAFLANMCGSMILPLFPIYIEQFHFSTFMMSILFSLFYVGRACGGVLAGKLYEVLGAKRTGILLLLLETMLMVGFVLGTSFLILGILRILQGLVSTGLTVFVRTSINEMSTEANRGIYNGYISSSEGAGMFLGPAISGAVATIALSTPFYLVGVCSVIALFAVIYMDIASKSSLNRAVITEETALSYTQKSRPSRKQILTYSTVHFLEMSAFAVFLTYFALYAKHVMGWTPFETSLAFTIVGGSSFMMAPVVGKISDALKDRLLLCIVGLGLIMIEVILFLGFSQHWIVYFGMFIGGIGGASYLDSFFAHIGDVVTDEHQSSFIGKVVSISEIGSIVSPIIAGLLVEAFRMSAAFYFNLGLVAVAMVIQFGIRNRIKRKPPSQEINTTQTASRP